MKYCTECGQRIPERTGDRLQRYEFHSGTSYKFWEIWRHDTSVFTRYGRIGTAGTQIVSTFDWPHEAVDYMREKIRGKLNKGYWEV